MPVDVCVGSDNGGGLRLFIEGDAFTEVEKGIRVAFARGGVNGLLSLGGEFLEESELSEGFIWWRELVVGCLERFCRLQGGEVPFEGGVWEKWLDGRPPMLGGELLTIEKVESIWLALLERLKEGVVELGGEEEGRLAFLRELNPFWVDLGRVMFHVAENPNSEERPFAFLATYARGASKKVGGEISHVPLGRAMVEYAEDGEGLKRLLVPVRRAADQSEVVQGMVESKRVFQAQAWSAGEAYGFLSEAAQLKNCGVGLRLPDWWKQKEKRRPQVVITLEGEDEQKSAVGMGALFRFSVEVALGRGEGGDKLTQEEWAELMAGDEGLVRLKGQWVEVDRKRLKEVLGHWKRVEAAQEMGVGEISFAEGMRWLAGMVTKGGGGLMEGLVEEDKEWFVVEAGEKLKAQLAQIRSGVVEGEPGQFVRAELRPYQEEGVQWLRLLGGLGLGACLADDMGLGKTLQTVAYLGWVHLSPCPLLRQGFGAQAASPRLGEQSRDPIHLRRGFGGHGDQKPELPQSSLIVVPASLLGNWWAELERFCPELRVFVAHKSLADGNDLKQFFRSPRSFVEEAGKQVVVTTYEMVTREKSLRDLEWEVLVLDEAQAIKNPGTQKTQAVKKLQARSRVALSGTPVENRLGDLWSLFDFLNPGLLGSSGEFAEAVKLMKLRGGKEGVDYTSLRELTGPYILRRLKTDEGVASDLPEKVEMKVRARLSMEQAKLYRGGVDELMKLLKEGHAGGKEEQMKRKGEVLQYLMRFKQVCNHPAQWLGDADFTAERSGKMLRLRELAQEVAERREKMLVFTQFKEMCGPLEDCLAGVFGKEGLILHGGTPVGERQELVKAFEDVEGAPFFVLSLKAGGTGLNLTAANHVVHFDRWWNPAVENQATDRAFRIGQQKNVMVHKFICQGTLEERIDALIEQKMSLAQEITGDGLEGESVGLTELGDEELLALVGLDLDQALL